MNHTNQWLVCIDFKNPWAFLAHQPTRALENKLGIYADWLPVSSPPLQQPVPATADDERGMRHRWFRAQYQLQYLQRYAAVQGVTIKNIYRAPEVSTAGIGLLWANAQGRDVQRRYTEAVFTQYWNNTLSLENVDEIEVILAESGADVTQFKAYLSTDGMGAYDGLQKNLKAAGVFTAPAYVVNNEVFIGRQNLPMVEWLLTGETGEPPI